MSEKQGKHTRWVDYCGCCGNEIPYGEWCLRCTQHLLPKGIPDWERTWFAQHGTDCPFQLKRRTT